MKRHRRLLVANAVIAELARQRMTREHLAALTGIDMSVLDRRLAGESAFDLEELEVVAVALNVEVARLLGDG